MTSIKIQTRQPNWHIIKDIFNQIHIINSVYQAFDYYSVLRKWVIKLLPLGSNSEILFFEKTFNHTQTLQGYKGGSPTTRIGPDTKRSFYHLKNQIKILPLTICHEHLQRGRDTSSLFLITHTLNVLVSIMSERIPQLWVMVATPGCGWSSSSIPDVAQQAQPQAGTKPVFMLSVARHKGAYKRSLQRRIRLLQGYETGKKTKVEKSRKVEKIQDRKKPSGNETVALGVMLLPICHGTTGGSNGSKVKHFLLVGRQKCLLYWSLKNVIINKTEFVLWI